MFDIARVRLGIVTGYRNQTPLVMASLLSEPALPCPSFTHTHTLSLSLLQPPFDGEDDDQLFINIVQKPVHYPRGMAEHCRKIISGVSCPPTSPAAASTFSLSLSVADKECQQEVGLWGGRGGPDKGTTILQEHGLGQAGQEGGQTSLSTQEC